VRKGSEGVTGRFAWVPLEARYVGLVLQGHGRDGSAQSVQAVRRGHGQMQEWPTRISTHFLHVCVSITYLLYLSCHGLKTST
jgi:hypothetical protein